MINTGIGTVLELEQVDDAGNPTGEVKPNLPGNPDYVESTERLDICPLPTGWACPIAALAMRKSDSVWYEFSLPAHVFLNKEMASLEVILRKNGTQVATKLYTSFSRNYFNHEFMDQSVGTFTIDLVFRNGAGDVVHSCMNLAAVTFAPVVTWEPVDPFCIRTVGCIDGYVLDSTGTQCIQVLTAPPTKPSGNGGTPGSAYPVQDKAWNNGGARVYRPGYPLSGDGVLEVALTVPKLWVNGNTPFSSATRNINDGRMNASAVWTESNPLNEWIGFARQVTISEQKTVYIGLAADNQFRFAVNGVDIVNNTGQIINGSNFNYWNIYPVQLSPGVNYIEMYGLNWESVGGIAVEIYDATLAQLQAVSTAAELDQYILFSSRDVRGQYFDLGQSVGYSCNAGWVLDNSDPNPALWVCKKIDRTLTVQTNTGMKGWANRRRLNNGVPDGFVEPNNNSGTGNYFPPVQDLVTCPV